MSEQWRKLLSEEFGCIDETFIDKFRAPGKQNRFAAWNPLEVSARYFKFLLFNVAERQSPRFFEAYRRIQNRETGSPLTVSCRGCSIDADYLAAVEEWEFLFENNGLNGVTKIVEIGAGFGRTCHTLTSICPGIEEYAIVDLDPMLALSRMYLRRVMPEITVRFVSSDDDAQISSLKPDLVINIDSFQEMPPAVIDWYMNVVVQRAYRFYCKNPVGKYQPETVGLRDVTPDQLMDVFSLGYCRNVIDIFNDEELRKAREAYLNAYCPPQMVSESGKAPFTVAASKPMGLFPYYQHVLYSRSHPIPWQ